LKAIEIADKQFAVFQAQKRIDTIDLEHELIHKKTNFLVIMSNESQVTKVIEIMDFLEKFNMKPGDTFVQNVTKGEDFTIIPNDSLLETLIESGHNLVVLVNKAQFPVGVINNVNIIKRISEALSCRDGIEAKEKRLGRVICTDLLPLKAAKREVEEQLVKKAYSIYKNTYKVGEVLEVDQSTVVKILKKYR